MLQQAGAMDLPTRESFGTTFQVAYRTYLADLDWRKVQSVLSHQDFNPSYSWISNNLGIAKDKVAEIIDGLITLRLIERTPNGFKILSERVALYEYEEYNQISREDKINLYNLLSHQIVDEVDTDSFAGVRVAATASSQALVDEFYLKVTDAMKDFVEKSTKVAKKDGIYAFTFTGANCLKGAGK